jgi:hypothetical protein
MRKFPSVPLIAFLLACALWLPLAAHAQATRTWVSGVGDDANTCSRTAPCKTLAGAISKTAAAGIINILDPAAVGAVTITKSITIQADEMFAGDLVSVGGNGIIVNALATDTVILRGLSINGINTGGNGIRILAAGTVRIENCNIIGFAESGIEVAPSTALRLSVQDTSIETILGAAANDSGIQIAPTGLGSVRAVIDRVRIHGAKNYGVLVLGLGSNRVVLRDSVISDVTGTGVFADATTGAVQMVIQGSSILESTINGVQASGANASVRLFNSIVTGNAQGLLTAASGQIVSYGNNLVAGNTANGAASSTVTPN